MNHHKALALSLALLLSQPASAMFKPNNKKTQPKKTAPAWQIPLPQVITSSPSLEDLKKEAESLANNTLLESSIVSPTTAITPATVATAVATIDNSEPVDIILHHDDIEIVPSGQIVAAEIVKLETTPTLSNPEALDSSEEIMVSTVEHEQYSDVEDELPLFEAKAKTTMRRNSWFSGAPTAQVLLTQLKSENPIQAEEAFQLRRDIENAIDTLTKSIKLHDKKLDNPTVKTINPEIQTVLAKIDANAEIIQTIEKLIDEAKRKQIHLDQDIKSNARGWIEKHDTMLIYLTQLIEVKKESLYNGQDKLNNTFDTRTPRRIAQRLAYLKTNRNTKQLKKARDLADWAIIELATNINTTLDSSSDVIKSTENCHSDANALISLLNAVDENYKRKTEIQISEDTHGQAFNALEQYRLKSFQANRLRNEQTKDQQSNVLKALSIIADRKLTPSIPKMNIDDSKEYVHNLTQQIEYLNN
jgi:hypothetical protein